MDRIKKIALIVLGSFSLLLGIIGIFLPLLPTTPLLLLAASSYLRSSDKLYKALIRNKYLGSYIKNYQEKRAIPKKTKILALTLLWVSIGSSVVFLISKIFVRVIIITIASIVTIHILKLKTLTDEDLIIDMSDRDKQETLTNEDEK
jgi:uncharacterized membrane protein YbaN (DUF454 family)